LGLGSMACLNPTWRGSPALNSFSIEMFLL